MTRFIAGAITGMVVFTAFEMPRASAQPQVPAGGPSRAPIFSPYLNLLNGGNPALNYFGLVVPQIQMQQQLSQLQLQQQAGTGGSQTVDPSMLYPSTGSVAVFNNTNGYFNRIYIGGGTSGGGGSISSGGASATGAPAAGASFNRMSGAFQRGTTGASTLQPSFAAPRTPATGATQPKQ